MLIEDLRLPCEHGVVGHCGPFCVKCRIPALASVIRPCWRTEQGKCGPHETCPGGRVPTRTELIGAIDIDYEAARVELADDYQRICDHLGDELAEIARWILEAALGENTA